MLCEHLAGSVVLTIPRAKNIDADISTKASEQINEFTKKSKLASATFEIQKYQCLSKDRN